MDFKETYEEKFFDKVDNQIITENKKKSKGGLIIFALILIALILIIPFMPSRYGNGDTLLDDMNYLNAIFFGAIIFIVAFGLPIFITMIRLKNDYNNGKKIVLVTKIKKLKHDKEDLKLSLTSPDFKSKWIFVYRDKFYPGIAENDKIMISYLPKTKSVLELKKYNK